MMKRTSKFDGMCGIYHCTAARLGLQRFFLMALFAFVWFIAGCNSQFQQLDIGSEGGIITVGDALLTIPAGALDTNVLISLLQDNSSNLELEENETPLSDVFSVVQNQEEFIDTCGAPFLLNLPFDVAALGGAIPDEATVYVKIGLEDSVFSMLGVVSGGNIEVELYCLPADADIQVVHNPNAILITGDDDTSFKALPAPTPWETTQWHVHLDTAATELREAVGTVLGKAPAQVNEDDIRLVVRNHVRFPAQEVCITYQSKGFRQPSLAIWINEEREKCYLLHLVRSRSHMEWSPNGELGQVNIAYKYITSPLSSPLGTIKGVIAHEVFHAIVKGYQINQGPAANLDMPFKGFNEGMATVMGHTLDHSGGIHVRNDIPPRVYTMMLNQPLGVFEPRELRYSNQDFFAYVGKRFQEGSMDYLVGSAMDGPFQNGVLDQTRKYLSNHPELQTGVSTSAEYLAAYRMALHNSFSLQFQYSLAEAYWIFAKDRAYENSPESRLRSDDPGTPWTFQSQRFDPSCIYQCEFNGNNETVELNYEGIPALKEIPPFSTRAILIKGNGFNAKLTLSFVTVNWLEDSLGNSMKAKVYRVGQNGIEITADENTASLNGFGTDFSQALVLLSNVSVESSYSVVLTAATEAVQVQCTPAGTSEHSSNRWRFSYDFDCRGNYTESPRCWYFEAGGTISQEDVGLMPTWSWHVEGDKLIIFQGEGYGNVTMEAYFSGNCMTLERGTMAGDYIDHGWWMAFRQ